MLRNLNISVRILLLVFVLLGLMVFGFGAGLKLLGTIGEKAGLIAEQDVPLLEMIGGVTTTQLKQSVEFQRAMRHGKLMILNDEAREAFGVARRGFSELTEEFDAKFRRASLMTAELAGSARDVETARLVAKTLRLLGDIRTLRDDYVNDAESVLKSFDEDELSRVEDRARRISRTENLLNDKLSAFLIKVSDFSSRSAAAMRDVRLRATRFVALVSSLSVLTALVLSLTISRSIIAPLKTAVKIAESVAGGEREVRFPATSRDETGVLLGALNRMLTALNDANRKLREANLTLEEKVRERTRELEIKNRLLDSSNRELDDFASVAAHDLKEPLRGIAYYADRLRAEAADKINEAERERISAILALTDRLRSLIESLLNYSRVGRTEMAFAATDLDATAREILESLRATLEREKVAVRFQGRLPTVFCDRVRVGEIFRNLVVNAVKYNDKPDKWIEIGARDDGVIKVLYVKDNGRGIAPRNHDRVFQIFRRLEEAKSADDGTGVGLTIVKKIVELHGGRVWIESEPGSGATFFFTLSAEAAANAA